MLTASLRYVMLDDTGTRGMAASESQVQVFFVGPVVKQVKDYKPVLEFSAAGISGYRDLSSA